MTHRYSRRETLRIGAAAFGLTLPALVRAEQARRPKARSAIILFLSGGPSQLDTWDLKPDAPEEIRGTFRPIATNVSGVSICEHMPRMARLADKYTIVRSLSHEVADHPKATYFALTGTRIARPVVQSSGLERNDRPHLGAVLARELGARQQMPPFVTVPEFISPVGVPRPGQHAGFLGARFDPYLIASDPNESAYSAGLLQPHAGASAERASDRLALLGRMERSIARSDEHDTARVKAFDLITSAAARQAFDLSREPTRVRDRYGRTTFGQSTLVARRLIEAGTRLVQVTFVRHDNGKGGQGYDSHASPPNPPHLDWCRDELLPPTDAAFAALIEDLSLRGLLDETLVLMLGEFGRTPRFNKNGGRDHWSRCYSMVVAGGGIAGGRVYGASDRIGAYPTRSPLALEDLMATVYHQLGIEPEMLIHDLQGRPHPLVEGKPVAGLLAG